MKKLKIHTHRPKDLLAYNDELGNLESARPLLTDFFGRLLRAV
ncbi:hypothetical protein [Streptomyces sp. NPDC001820]